MIMFVDLGPFDAMNRRVAHSPEQHDQSTKKYKTFFLYLFLFAYIERDNLFN